MKSLLYRLYLRTQGTNKDAVHEKMIHMEAENDPVQPICLLEKSLQYIVFCLNMAVHVRTHTMWYEYAFVRL